MNMQSGGNRLRFLIRALSLSALLSMLGWMLWPVQVTLEGNGIIQPVFEHLVKVVPHESGVVCKVNSARLNAVQKGDVLLEYVPIGKASFLSYSSMISPGGASRPEALPEWYTELEQKRRARIEAANRWQGLMFKRQNPGPWERELAGRLVMLAVNQGDLERNAAQQRENIRLGRAAANQIHVRDETLGQIVPAERGSPLTSPADGILYSLWARPVMQITGAMHSNLPIPSPGSAPTSALAAGTAGTPVAEILSPGTPGEVLALLPLTPGVPAFVRGWKTFLDGAGPDAMEVTNIEFGTVPISPDDARLLVPGLAGTREAVFVRLRLKEPGLSNLDKKVRVRLISSRYPRVWYWISSRRS